MEVKKIVLIILIVVLSLTSYFYLQGKYNSSVIEYHFRGEITDSSFKIISEKYKNVYLMNYFMDYGRGKLIMTTGMDKQVKDIQILHGQLITDINDQTAMIGDKAADRYFRTEDVLDKEINVFDREYRIIGIIQDSNDIYIPFDLELEELNWRRKVISYMPKHEKAFYYLMEKFHNDLKTLGLDVYDVVVYKEKIYGYLNLIILSLIYVLVYFSKRLYKHMKKDTLIIWNGYKEKRRVIDWYKYVADKKIAILKVTGEVMCFIFAIYLVFKSIGQMSIPYAMKPDNYFSLMSYIDVIRLNWGKFIMHLENGGSDILVHTFVINIFILVIVMIYGLINIGARHQSY